MKKFLFATAVVALFLTACTSNKPANVAATPVDSTSVVVSAPAAAATTTDTVKK